MTTTKSKKGVALLWIAAAAFIALLLSFLIPGITPWSPPSAAPVCNTTEVHYFALDGNKETEYAFGPEVTQVEQDSILGELHDRRCVDPALTATHMYEWGLISFDEIQSAMAKFVKDASSWRDAIVQMEKLEAEAAISITSVAKGLPSLYMVPNSEGSVDVYQGFTSSAGDALTFVNGGRTVMLRLECGFQPIRPPGFPPEVPPIPCPPGNEIPECSPKSDNAADYTYPEDKPAVTIDKPAESTPPAVVTTQPGGRDGGVVDTATNAPGSETGITAPGAEPPVSEPVPPVQVAAPTAP